jgi:hypothetical protein
MPHADFQLTRAILLFSVFGIAWGTASTSVAADKKDKEEAKPERPATAGLSPNEQRIVKQLEGKLRTKFNSKENPGDKDTWYVFGFADFAAASIETKRASAVPGVIITSRNEQSDSKVVRKAAIVQGRTEAAIELARFLYSPNQATGKLEVDAPTQKEGYLSNSQGQFAADRKWEFRPFDNEAEAREFYDSINPDKKTR